MSVICCSNHDVIAITREGFGADLLLVACAPEAAGHHELPLHLLGLHLSGQLKEGGCCLIHLLHPHHFHYLTEEVTSMLSR